MPRSIQQAQPPLEFIPPALDATVVKLLQALLPLIIQSRTSIRSIQAENVEVLVDLYRQFQAGKVRFLIAFRHPSADDPLCLAYLLSRLVPQVAREQGVALPGLIHAHFMYDRGIPLWAGKFMGWLYARLGGTPIHRGKIDLLGLRSARNLFANGTLPMAAAPEGATNGHTEIVSPLEPGISQLGFWCLEDLQKAGRTEDVLIVPLGIRYRYIAPPWKAIDDLLTALEADAGLVGLPAVTGESVETLRYRRLYRLGEHLLGIMEDYYTRFYHQVLPTVTSKKATSIKAADPYVPISNEQFATRLNALLDAALKVAEQFFNLQPKGTVIERCRRLEQAAWDYIYREDLKQVENLAPLERGLADRVAEEADLRAWHMRIVESFVAVTGKYVLEKPTAERFAETALLMWDMFARLKGKSPFNRPKLGKQKALLTIGQPIPVSTYWDTYKENRKGARQAIADLTQELQTALETMAIDD
ncbi:1-acyl-sn-glycerol-3-phosphate acyltransferase [Leptothermofonsia sichuanensis E412]|uniref:1-acyl-sn-glycerol-3-phosphate acyltransferase n=1 Tax=Leptothermofonsia sichuanensis TaxID=2917832 RepID=UPI001CA73336|nr:1-acyl-sn-glycerol-3-phosphate acyltransferase [Leptothermofonsia sichuanensis]QZZ21557.1 1-acyl-sn-glycerol-3-phosphate acyltransferase [Leptothermofonsia sichuanensis E412]